MYKINLAALILFYEKADQTIECIKSILPSGIKIYILNNNSSEASTEKVRNFCADYDNITIFNSDENLGVSRGRNFLIKNTSEEWMFIIDNDIIVKTPDWLEKIENYIENNKNIEIFIPKLFNLQNGIYDYPRNFTYKNGKIIVSKKSATNFTNMLLGGSTIIKRSIFDKFGLFDEEMFIGFEDFELSIRALLMDSPLNAKVLKDIEAIHDHRTVKTIEDKKAIQVRYNIETIKKAYDRLSQKHNIKFEHDIKEWNDIQLKLFLEENVLFVKFYKLKSKVKEFVRSIIFR